MFWIRPNAASIPAIVIMGITTLHDRCFHDRNVSSRTKRNATVYPIMRNKWTNVVAGVMLKGANPATCVTFSRLSRIVARVGERIPQQGRRNRNHLQRHIDGKNQYEPSEPASDGRRQIAARESEPVGHRSQSQNQEGDVPVKQALTTLPKNTIAERGRKDAYVRSLRESAEHRRCDIASILAPASRASSYDKEVANPFEIVLVPFACDEHRRFEST